ncbi:hypothetical protein [Streptomyces sp. RerS4]|uniref:hypothetical protein n=1 Tax=Streptomyces sp. RerS4 TaxID=2942449 RepID=UPI00201C9C43|nr:hypothetical protein [Streptomyces sp. RerS4]UQX04702.1 hypothetical protein M4D82_32485 [Streptomyces sp. RerS4]
MAAWTSVRLGSGRRWAATGRSRWRPRDVFDTTLVQPDLVAETSADTSIDCGGVYRHPS